MYKLTIITSTYNAVNHLPNLIKTIREYKREWIQWIVVDGESIDGTIKLLNDNLDIIDKLIIEKDTGIYDAWNKAIHNIKSNYICFIGSDDNISISYFNEIENCINVIKNNVICFKIATFEKDIDNILFELHSSDYVKPKHFPFNLGFHHQGTLFHKSLFENNTFNIKYKILGDLAQLTMVYGKLNPIIIKTKEPLYFFNNGGISSVPQKLILRYRERIEIIKSIPKNYAYKFFLIFSYKLKIFFSKIKKYN